MNQSAKECTPTYVGIRASPADVFTKPLPADARDRLIETILKKATNSTETASETTVAPK